MHPNLKKIFGQAVGFITSSAGALLLLTEAFASAYSFEADGILGGTPGTTIVAGGLMLVVGAEIMSQNRFDPK